MLLTFKVLLHITKIGIYKTIIVAVLLLMCEAWSLWKPKIKVFEKKILRKINEKNTTEWEWRIKQERRSCYNWSNIIETLKSFILKWRLKFQMLLFNWAIIIQNVDSDNDLCNIIIYNTSNDWYLELNNITKVLYKDNFGFPQTKIWIMILKSAKFEDWHDYSQKE